MWHFKMMEVHLGIYNSHPEGHPVTFDIQMREYAWRKTLPQEIQQMNQVFEIVHEGTDAHLTSDIERSEKDL